MIIKSNKSHTLVPGMKGASPSSFFKSTNSCDNWRHKRSISLNILKICLFVYHLSNCIICFQYNGNILITLTISWLSLKFCNLLCSKADNLGKSSSFASFGVFGFFVACFFSILTSGISFLSNFTTLRRTEYLRIQTYEKLTRNCHNKLWIKLRVIRSLVYHNNTDYWLSSFVLSRSYNIDIFIKKAFYKKTYTS